MQTQTEKEKFTKTFPPISPLQIQPRSGITINLRIKTILNVLAPPGSLYLAILSLLSYTYNITQEVIHSRKISRNFIDVRI